MKRIAVLLYGADRQLWRGRGATLILRDLNRSRLTILASERLEHPTVEIQLETLPFDAGQVYGLTVEAKGHRHAAQLVRRQSFLRQEADRRIEQADALFRLMLIPHHCTTPDIDDGYHRLEALGSPICRHVSAEWYGRLVVAQQMAFLNIEAKLRETYVGAEPLMASIVDVLSAHPDRLYLRMAAGLKAAVERSTEFVSAPGHNGYPDSWKHTRFESGNLQLSFARDSARGAFAVDTDIDLARGLGHVGEWLDNNVFRHGQKTNQTLVYALLFAQGILPAYTVSQLTEK